MVNYNIRDTLLECVATRCFCCGFNSEATTLMMVCTYRVALEWWWALAASRAAGGISPLGETSSVHVERLESTFIATCCSDRFASQDAIMEMPPCRTYICHGHPGQDRRQRHDNDVRRRPLTTSMIATTTNAN